MDIVKPLKVVNDCAERAVNLIQSYNNLFTHDEEQKQYMLQLVALCRKEFPDARKNTSMGLRVFS